MIDFKWLLKNGITILVEASDEYEDGPIKLGFSFEPFEKDLTVECFALYLEDHYQIECHAATLLGEELMRLRWEQSSANRYA